MTKIWTEEEIAELVSTDFRWTKAALQTLVKNRLIRPWDYFPEGDLDDLADWPKNTGHNWTPPQVATIRGYLLQYTDVLCAHLNREKE